MGAQVSFPTFPRFPQRRFRLQGKRGCYRLGESGAHQQRVQVSWLITRCVKVAGTFLKAFPPALP
jgi:hypothetical protein